MQEELKNGMELLLSLQLSIELLDEYNANRLLKRKLNMAKEELEKAVLPVFSDYFNRDEEFVQNSMKYKAKAISTIAKYNDADCVLACDFLDRFDKNIDVARKKGVIFFDKMY